MALLPDGWAAKTRGCFAVEQKGKRALSWGQKTTIYNNGITHYTKLGARLRQAPNLVFARWVLFSLLFSSPLPHALRRYPGCQD